MGEVSSILELCRKITELPLLRDDRPLKLVGAALRRRRRLRRLGQGCAEPDFETNRAKVIHIIQSYVVLLPYTRSVYCIGKADVLWKPNCN